MPMMVMVCWANFEQCTTPKSTTANVWFLLMRLILMDDLIVAVVLPPAQLWMFSLPMGMDIFTSAALG
jgi:hypothetical protein